MRTTLPLASTLVLFSVSLSAQARPAEPYIQRGVCPFECCTYREWVATNSIVVYQTEGSADTLFILQPQESFAAITGNVHLIHLGVVVLKQPFTIAAEDSIPELKLSAGDSAYVLSYRGEGWYDVWIRGRIRTLPSFWDDRREYPRPTDRPGRLVREPQDVWWVQVRSRDGRLGWIRMDQAHVGGADACG